MRMAATVMLRQQTLSNVSKLLRQTQIRVVKFSSDTGGRGDETDNVPKSTADPEEGKKKLSSLLSSIKTGEKKQFREPSLSKPKQKKPLKRDGSGNIRDAVKPQNIGIDSDKLVDATKQVSKLAKGARAQARTESDLLKKLKSISDEAKSAKHSDLVSGEKSTAASLLSDLNVEKKKEPVSRVMADRKQRQEQQQNLSLEQIAFLEKRARLRRQRTGASLEEQHVPVDIFGGPGLGIFTEPLPATADVGLLSTWRKCAQRELELLSTPSPRNAIEESILWTEQGKLWQFPIDNEQDLDYSFEPFYEHVFLEKHLEPWCPPGGPVRHFMETVCVALSKNPHMSVEYKSKTITWFKDYFEQPEINEILVHQGAWQEEQRQSAQ